MTLTITQCDNDSSMIKLSSKKMPDKMEIREKYCGILFVLIWSCQAYQCQLAYIIEIPHQYHEKVGIGFFILHHKVKLLPKPLQKMEIQSWKVINQFDAATSNTLLLYGNIHCSDVTMRGHCNVVMGPHCNLTLSLYLCYTFPFSELFLILYSFGWVNIFIL